jgi:uncharacterized damage-inducible protein DinB
MNVDDVRLLYEYDRWANEQVLQAAAALSGEQFTRARGGGCTNVRDTLLHILGGEWIWLTYWKEPSPSAEITERLVARRDDLFRPEVFPDVAAVRSKWEEIAKEMADFVSRLTNEDLSRMLPFRKTEAPLVQLMQHVTNHSTYHRGQIALMMRELGAAAVATDFHVFVAERGRGS